MIRAARSAQSAVTDQATRTAILDAAERQLRRFGPEKLTVLDIGREAGMSHPNLYRFFGSKAEILEAVVARWLEGVERPLEPIVRETGPAAERLHRFILEHHRLKARRVACDAEMFRCYGGMINLAGREPIIAHLARMAAMLAAIVADGVAKGEFAADVDPAVTAATIREATISFHNPSLLPAVLEAGDAEPRLERVVRLLVAGLRPGSR